MKQRVIATLRRSLAERIRQTQDAIDTTRSARDTEDRSTAGDKHEVGRAMAQIEMDRLEMQRTQNEALLRELERVPVERTFDRVAFGALVSTDAERYFLCIGLGRVPVDGASVLAISPASPIGRSLLGKRVGDTIAWNGGTFRIDRIE
ncbi:MAG: GreA/GreB family elongation factor [Flavobacteriales bacterium]